jgi:hypothetical protein
MENSLKIKPLMRYELTFEVYNPMGEQDKETEAFTADEMVHDEDTLVFSRTGNVIRKYIRKLPYKIIVTPVVEIDEQG